MATYPQLASLLLEVPEQRFSVFSQPFKGKASVG